MVMKGTEERGNCCRFSVVTCWCVLVRIGFLFLFIYLFLGDNILIKFGFNYRGNLSIFGLTGERATLSESMHSLGFSLSRITVGVTAALRIESEPEWSEVGTVNIARGRKRY